MPVMLLVLMPVLILGAPTVTPRQKTLPGVANAVQKTAPNLFQLRDHVATWYCQRVRVSEAPCVVHETLARLRSTSGKSQSEKDEIFMGVLDNPVQIDKRLAKAQYQKMFVTFCTEATNDPMLSQTCDDPELRKTYQLAM